MSRKTVTAWAILMVLGGFVAGVLFQRTFTIGKSFRWVMALFGGDPVEMVVKAQPATAEFDWSPYATELNDLRLVVKRPVDTESTTRRLLLAKPKEESFRSSLEVVAAYRELQEKKAYREITEMEIRHDRFFRPEELDFQVSSEDHDHLWAQRLHAVVDFRNYLEKRGIHLIYTPVPNQVDIELPMLINAEEYVPSSPAYTDYLVELSRAGVDLVDLRYEFGQRAIRGQRMFNRFDHHWSPTGVEIGAKAISRRILEIATGLEEVIVDEFDYRNVYANEPITNFPDRSIEGSTSPMFARQIEIDGQPIGSYLNSRVAVFGDSMAIMYGAPFAADLASHLSMFLGYPCRSMGKGSGAPLVPQMFLDAYGTKASASDPVIVIWTGVSRHQEYVSINDFLETFEAESDFDGGLHTVFIKDRSRISDPRDAPYPDALFSAIVRVESDRQPQMEALVHLPAFRSRKLTEESAIQEDKRVKLHLVRWERAIEDDPELKSRAVFDDIGRFGLPKFYGKLSADIAE